MTVMRRGAAAQLRPASRFHTERPVICTPLSRTCVNARPAMSRVGRLLDAESRDPSAGEDPALGGPQQVAVHNPEEGTAPTRGALARHLAIDPRTRDVQVAYGAAPPLEAAEGAVRHRPRAATLAGGLTRRSPDSTLPRVSGENLEGRCPTPCRW
jgi:hypothetical protein